MQQPLGQTVKPVKNARHEAYQMRMQGRNYNTNKVEQALQGTNATVALEKMIVPEVNKDYFKLILIQNISQDQLVTIINNIYLFRVKVQVTKVKNGNLKRLKKKTIRLMMK